MGSHYDCVVVGGGPAGSSAAISLARRGHTVSILESGKVPGLPVRCGESISLNTLNLSGLEDDGPWMVNRFSGYRIRSPSGDDFFSSTSGVNIRRDLFDLELWRRALDNGAEGRAGSPAREVRRDPNGCWRIKGPKNDIRARSLILACGVNRHLLPQVMKGLPLTIKALGAKIRIEDPSEELLFFVKGSLRGGYGYYFPRGYEVNIGVTTYGNVMTEFDWLLEKTGLNRKMVESYHGGEIPVTGMWDPVPHDNCIIVGDAGGFSNPVSKGGIVGSILSGKTGAEALSDSLSGKENALEIWKKSMDAHPACDQANLEKMRFLSSLDDKSLDSLTDIAKGRDIWSIRKTELIKRAWKRPDLLKAVKGSLHLIRGGRDWARWAF